MELRCNRIIDCPNDRCTDFFLISGLIPVALHCSTDEESCDIVEYGSTYRTEFAPVEVSRILKAACLLQR